MVPDNFDKFREIRTNRQGLPDLGGPLPNKSAIQASPTVTIIISIPGVHLDILGIQVD